jgi:hypothetical protein
MSHKSHNLMAGIVLAAATIFPMALASAQAGTVQDDLMKMYKFVKIGSDTGGYSVVEEGTVLAIQKGGILAVPYDDKTDFKTKYQDGQIHAPSGLSVMGRKSLMGKFGKEQTTHLFAKNDKVYPTKIDVNVAKDTVTMGIVACDTCNNTDPPTYNKAEVVFEFPKGSLANATTPAVQKIISQVFVVSKDDSKDAKKDDKGGDKGGDQGGQQAGGGAAAGGGDQGQQAADAPAADPVSIEKGMSIDEVVGAMGQPEKKVSLGVKQIYYYKDMKVIFMSGKVSDVQ